MERLFGLDVQLLFDMIIMFVFLMLLFVILTKLFFKPVRAFMEKRAQQIEGDKAVAAEENSEADKLKLEYEDRLKEVHKEAESILSESRKKAMKCQEEIIDQAKVQASTIIEKANKEAEEEKRRIKDEVKLEMAALARSMAAPYVSSEDPFREAILLEETLKEMGGEAWLS